ncbi:acetyl-CoA carboxylase, carboxyltransferase subunit beta [Nonomuraea sp. NPDC050404]|uniref:acetyl-CoA carboxylase, carboxyltransferase subunit beta n=1 Tax=Nonomuraea sp. NPDC050404 TaxID=3155783 RepID=UPI0033F6A749
MNKTATRSTWLLCPGCREMLYGRSFERAAKVCPHCGHHARLSAPERLAHLLDPESMRVLDFEIPDADPLSFTDTVPYPERLRAARDRTGLEEAVICARGTIGGHPVVVAAMDFRFFGGSLGSAVGEAITLAAEAALRERTPLVMVTASGGARMQEGVLSLMQMAKTSQAIAQLDEAGILTVTVVTDPTFGGVAASFATLADVIVAEPGARLGFAGPRVIERTIRQSLPEGFQTAEFLLEHGIVDVIRPREELPGTLADLLAVAARQARQGEQGGQDQGPAPVTDPADLPERNSWEAVRAARDLGRPSTLDYIALLTTGFVELHGDRRGADCPALVGGLGYLDDIPVVLIGTQKGHTAAELNARNYGMPTPAGYRKAARLMRLAAKLGLPVVTLIDTAGAYPGLEAERDGAAVAIAENLRLMAGLPVPTVAVVTGEGGSGGALALAVANRVLICANAVYSVISPEGCAAILWDDPSAAPRAAEALRVDARRLLELGAIDAVVPEPGTGAQTDHRAAAAALRGALTGTLRGLMPMDAMNLVLDRHARFRRFGAAPAGIAEGQESAAERRYAERGRGEWNRA